MVGAMMHSATDATYAMTVPALIVADDGAEALAALEAISLAGGRSLGRVGWAEAAERLQQHSVLGLLVVEAEDVPDAVIAAVLPHVDALARAIDARVVVSFARHQIDLVAAHLFGDHVDLLCTPSVADRVAALAVALMPRTGRLQDSKRDADSTRLRQLNKEIARIAEIIARLNNEEGEPGSGAGLKGHSSDRDPIPEHDAPPVAARDVREVIRARRLRDQFFERGLFEDPAWDMLLDLFAAELEQTQVSVSSLCIAATVAPTTALRWIAKMTEAGVFVRHADPFDKRRAFMALSPRARDGMRDYFAAVKRGGPVA
jgi:hypothetical protein